MSGGPPGGGFPEGRWAGPGPMMGGRGPMMGGPPGRGFRGRPGRGGPFGFRGGGPRAPRGQVRAAVLALLGERSMHGYEMIQELEDRSGGLWRPSPGSIYPTLQLLEDEGLVTSEEVEGKRTFALTDSGRAEADRLASEKPPWDRLEEADSPQVKLHEAAFQVGAAAMQVAHAGSEEQVKSALEALAEARRRIYAILAETD
jgi:DNA-binding PadR family transcriptional regulator